MNYLTTKTQLTFMKMGLFLTLILSAIFISPASVAGQSCTYKQKELCTYKSRLGVYEPNYVIYQWTEKDEAALEAHYSFKYLFTRAHCMKEEDRNNPNALPIPECLENWSKRIEFFFSYTGEFDFYMRTRDSDPVVNRISNPAFHLRQNYDYEKSRTGYRSLLPAVRWIDIGVEHRSNGQVTDADEPIGQQPKDAQTAYLADDHEYFDGISRGSNYVSAEVHLAWGKSHHDRDLCDQEFFCFELWLSGKVYATSDSNITWGPLANKGLEFSDYDSGEFIVSTRFDNPVNLFELPFVDIPRFDIGVETVVGAGVFNGVSEDIPELSRRDFLSYDFYIAMPLETKDKNISIPLFLRWHQGPMNTLSNYTAPRDSFGVGFKLNMK